MIPACPHCKAKLLEHHAADCRHWGQVLPSEVPGYIESVLRSLRKCRPPCPRFDTWTEEEHSKDCPANH